MLILFVKKTCGYTRIHVFVDCYRWGVSDNAVSPAFTNLDYTLTVYDETPPATSLYTVSVTESPEVTMTTATTLFTFDSNSSNHFQREQ